MIEQIIKEFDTKHSALNYMQIMTSPETVLVSQGNKWLVVTKKQIATLDGECSAVDIQTS